MGVRRVVTSAVLGWRRRHCWGVRRGRVVYAALLLLGAWLLYLWVWPSPFGHAHPLFRGALDGGLLRLPWARSQDRFLRVGPPYDCCMTSLLNFDSYVVVLQNVVLDPSCAEGNKGGEDLFSVMGQKEDNEFLHLKPGFFKLQCACSKPNAPYFYSGNHFPEWYDAVSYEKTPDEGRRMKPCSEVSLPDAADRRKLGDVDVVNAAEVAEIDRPAMAPRSKPLAEGKGVDAGMSPLSAISRSDVQSKALVNKGGVAKCLEAELVVAVVRRDYANLYWGIIELHAAYVTARLLGTRPNHVTLLLLDAHPQGKLDPLWHLFFRQVVRVGTLQQKVHIPVLAWGIPTLIAPVVMREGPAAFFTDFRKDMLSAVGVPMTSRNCLHLVIRLLERRDYVAHARNPTGRVKRKLGNLGEILSELRRSFPQDDVRSYRPDLDPVNEQVKKMAGTDILIGMHGAGLAHVIFQRDGSGLVELFPTYYRIVRNPHFRLLAEWSNVHYASWYNLDLLFLDDVIINVDPDVVVELVRKMRLRMCNEV